MRCPAIGVRLAHGGGAGRVLPVRQTEREYNEILAAALHPAQRHKGVALKFICVFETFISVSGKLDMMHARTCSYSERACVFPEKNSISSSLTVSPFLLFALCTALFNLHTDIFLHIAKKLY